MKNWFTLCLFLLPVFDLQRGIAGAPYTPPASPRATFNFNPGWKFIREDVANADKMDFDDAKWNDVSTPHTFNDVDTFDEIITRSGEHHQYTGFAWYRKHFKLPAGAKDGKVFIEFEGLRQAAQFFVNGKPAGKYENGVTACGLDVTTLVKFGDGENVLAVRVDASNSYKEESSGVGFQWNTRDFNPIYGGLNQNVRLHLAGKVYQTLPLYENLQTVGVYVYATNISVAARTADVTVESQVRNESDDPQSIDLSVVVVDANGVVRATLKGETYDMVGGETRVLTAGGSLTNVNLWTDVNPNLYEVYSLLIVEGKVVDVCKIRTGFRKVEFKGGAGKGGVWLNDKFVYLTGYAQRTSDEWAGLGQAYPEWLHDYDAELIRSTHANYIRWMHIAPQRANVAACDKFGIIEVAPAGDKEKDVEGRQWEQRLEVMRDTMIYFRNSPSILFWEAGNSGVSGGHMKQMRELRLQFDPNGGRAMGCRTLNDASATPHAEYFGVMIGQDERTDRLAGYKDMFRAYSAERRDLAPLIETEDFRDEAARRFWDDYSPPHFGFKPGTNDTWKWNSETFCIAAAKRYFDYASQTISNTDTNRSKWSGYASIIWADSNSHGRQYDSEVCRVSGKVDAVRLPKQAYYVYRVMQNAAPDIHIIGHWNYPMNTVKTICVAANHCDAVELFVNEKSKGVVSTPTNGYIFAFSEITFEPGAIKAVAKLKGKPVAQYEIPTTSDAKRLKLTPHVSPIGFQADGADVVLFDVEVVDEQGCRCPTDEARVDFKLEGPAIWRGGYNSGRTNSVNNLWLYTECGVNRVAIRSTLKSGLITLTATRPNLEPAKVQIESKPAEIKNGLVDIRQP
jgi:beta-galactosidase